LTSKGQITIPKEIRERLRLEAGHRVEFLTDAGGQVVLKARNGDVRTLKGSIRSRRRRAPSLKEINSAIARSYAGA
jgi:AbrB family looped-hinge helix DNA binding protein